MPAWSTEIAGEFIRLADAEQIRLDQMQLQKLVYIAHGWCLAGFDQPLTGDRPEAWKFGPVYSRLANLLRLSGTKQLSFECFGHEPVVDLNASELELISIALRDFGRLPSAKLAALTQRSGTPWARIYAGGAGEYRDIPHSLVRDQFRDILQGSESSSSACSGFAGLG